MKRDMDLIREILLEIEAHPEPWGDIKIKIQGSSPEEVSYHVKLLYQAGLIEAIDLSSMGNFVWVPQSLTWQGHEFLSASKDISTWRRASRLVLEKTGGLSLELLKFTLMELLKPAVQEGVKQLFT
jgi:DNA-binding transcriptional ArsR family regulator